MLQNVVSPIKKTPARAALEQCPIGVAILDTANQERLFANQALADIFEAGSVAGMLAGELRDTWVDQAEYARLIKQLNDGQHFANLETERLTLTGRPIWLLMNTQDLEFLGKAAKLVWHVDITDRKEAEAAVVASREELNYQIAELRDREERLEEQAKTLVNLAEDQAELRMELQRLNQNKDKFFSIIAHDLRSPFNALMGYTELLTAGARTMKREVMADYSASVHEAAQQAFKLMENLLQWSRLQMDQVSMEITNLDLSQTARTNIDLLTPVAAKKGVELVDGTIQVVMAAADRDMMDTILRNLISNA
ncbi:MAG: HAMP domain-containing histidine kinase, partial [Rhodospirillaceae bacterium]|nr:HAMP domain-containing histidine kinase [Rhodospirillaceae bacterium]